MYRLIGTLYHGLKLIPMISCLVIEGFRDKIDSIVNLQGGTHGTPYSERRVYTTG